MTLTRTCDSLKSRQKVTIFYIIEIHMYIRHHYNYEPQYDKTNKNRPAKTQISLGIRPVWSESSLSAWRNIESLATH